VVTVTTATTTDTAKHTTVAIGEAEKLAVVTCVRNELNHHLVVPADHLLKRLDEDYLHVEALAPMSDTMLAWLLDAWHAAALELICALDAQAIIHYDPVKGTITAGLHWWTRVPAL
jgi:diketogulonate reductase-like aldo/keto reductase